MLSKLFKALLITVILLQVSIIAQAQISNPSGEIRSVNPDEIWAQTLRGSFYNEFWNYQFYFDNGMTAHIVFSAANFGSLKSPVSGVRISVYNPNGTVHQLSREYPIDLLIQDRENYRFQLHPEREIYFEGKLPNEHRIVINTVKDGITYDINLRLHNIQPAKKWSSGNFTVHDEQVGIVTHIPYARARGYISVNNNRSNVTGSAYMDHTFQNQTTTRLMDSGYRFVHHADSKNWDVTYMMLPEKNNRDNRTIGYRLISENGEITLKGVGKVHQFHAGSSFGDNLPRIVEIELENSSIMRISRMEDQEKFSILGELSWIARRAARGFLGGEVVDYRGKGVLQETSHRPKNGNYNFFLIK